MARVPKAFDWASYLQVFHSERAGVGEEVLRRSVAGRSNPYRWLARAVANRATTILDVACGSGAMARELAAPGRNVVGVDLHARELELAHERAGDSELWVNADARALPFADATFDAVVSAKGLMVVDTDPFVAEIARVLKPGGVMAVLVPGIRPMNGYDIATYVRLAYELRSRPKFPDAIERTGIALAMNAHGLRRVEEARERYRFAVRCRADAELIVSALYLPTTDQRYVEKAVTWLAERANRQGSVTVAIPMRRVVALRTPFPEADG